MRALIAPGAGTVAAAGEESPGSRKAGAWLHVGNCFPRLTRSPEVCAAGRIRHVRRSRFQVRSGRRKSGSEATCWRSGITTQKRNLRAGTRFRLAPRDCLLALSGTTLCRRGERPSSSGCNLGPVLGRHELRQVLDVRRGDNYIAFRRAEG